MNFIRLVVNQSFKTNLLQIRTKSCWSCNKTVDNLALNLFCAHCNALQEPDEGHNYFKIIGLNESYNLDENDLSKRYKDLQKYLHPDKFGNRNKKEQEISEKYSSLVNEAYKTLLDPLSRGIYMLHLRGKEIPEKTEVDQTFLLKIMAKNEEVEEAESDEEIMELNRQNKMVIKDLQEQCRPKVNFWPKLKPINRLSPQPSAEAEAGSLKFLRYFFQHWLQATIYQ